MKKICQNRKAHFDYEILEKIEAGIVLQGAEIKSARQHLVSLDGAYAIVEGKEAFLLQCNIEPYSHSSQSLSSTRPRKLLLKKQEIKRLSETVQAKGSTLIPLSMYLKNGFAKIELGVCKGKKNYDKRNSIKEQEAKKEMRN